MVYGRVSADTKACGSPLYLGVYFNTFSNKNQQKTAKECDLLAALSIAEGSIPKKELFGLFPIPCMY